MSVVVAFNRPPTRAIHVRRSPVGRGWWVAEFAGDPWHKSFVLADAKLALMDALTDPDVRLGLPIVIAEARARRKAGGGQ